MATKSPAKNVIAKITPHLLLMKKKESILLKEITFIEKNMATYRAERKASWKSFKSKMESDIAQIKNSVEALTHSQD